MASFSQMPAVKKDDIFGAARNFFLPFLISDGFNLKKETVENVHEDIWPKMNEKKEESSFAYFDLILLLLLRHVKGF